MCVCVCACGVTSSAAVEQGDPGDEMFFIHRGTVDVVSEDGVKVFASMHGGEFFGLSHVWARDS